MCNGKHKEAYYVVEILQHKLEDELPVCEEAEGN